jgi:hypothetical protein
MRVVIVADEPYMAKPSASAPSPTRGVGERTVDRACGLSARLKFTLQGGYRI